MDKLNTRQKVLLVLMVVVVLYAVYDFFLAGSGGGDEPVNVQQNRTAANQGIQTTAFDTTISAAAQQTPVNLKELDLGWKKDPFFRINEKPMILADTTPRIDPLSAYELTGVMGIGENAEASINGELYKKGDKLGNYEIVHIHENYVILKSGNQVLNLRAKK